MIFFLFLVITWSLHVTLDHVLPNPLILLLFNSPKGSRNKLEISMRDL